MIVGERETVQATYLRFAQGGWKELYPNDGTMVMNPMVESVKHHQQKTNPRIRKKEV